MNKSFVEVLFYMVAGADVPLAVQSYQNHNPQGVVIWGTCCAVAVASAYWWARPSRQSAAPPSRP